MNVSQLNKWSQFDLIMCIISVGLVVLSPNNYSYGFCLLIHNLFLFTFAYNTYKNRKEGFLSFNFLFSISLYCTSFIYPIFIYTTSEKYFSMFSYGFNENLISYSSAVAYMAYCFLQLGLSYRNRQEKAALFQKSSIGNSKKALITLSWFFLILFIYFLYNNGLYYFADQFIYSASSGDKIMGYVVQFITPIAYALLFLAFYQSRHSGFNFLFAISLVYVYAIAILSTGSRTIPLSIIIISLLLYNDRIKRLGIPKMAVLGVFFIIVMSLAGALRGGGELISISNLEQNASEVINEKTENYFSFANELIMCNRNLYFLIETTESKGYTYGLTQLTNILGIIPFLRGAFMSLTGIPEYLMGSGLYNTVLTTGPNYTRGLGTHAVSDIYICWGLVGVIVVFYLYGFIMSKLKSRKNNMLCLVAYYVAASNAIYACRASIFDVNSIVWTVFIIYAIMKFSRGSSVKRSI